jgi:hypothetical protein
MGSLARFTELVPKPVEKHSQDASTVGTQKRGIQAQTPRQLFDSTQISPLSITVDSNKLDKDSAHKTTSI